MKIVLPNKYQFTIGLRARVDLRVEASPQSKVLILSAGSNISKTFLQKVQMNDVLIRRVVAEQTQNSKNDILQIIAAVTHLCHPSHPIVPLYLWKREIKSEEINMDEQDNRQIRLRLKNIKTNKIFREKEQSKWESQILKESHNQREN